jgi:hypothetical protein
MTGRSAASLIFAVDQCGVGEGNRSLVVSLGSSPTTPTSSTTSRKKSFGSANQTEIDYAQLRLFASDLQRSVHHGRPVNPNAIWRQEAGIGERRQIATNRLCPSLLEKPNATLRAAAGLPEAV